MITTRTIRIVSWFCIFLLLGLVRLVAAAGLVVGSVTGATGSTVMVPISLTNGGATAAVQLDITYDASQMSTGDAVAGATLPANYRVVSAEITRGLRRIVVVPPISNAPLPNGAIVNLPFRILSTATNASKLVSTSQPLLSDKSSTSVPADLVLAGLVADPANTTADSNQDGIPDVYAITHGLNPMDPTLALQDPDVDGLTNLQEFQLGTNPLNADSDVDGIPDGWEVANGLNPLNAGDAQLDPDGDGESNTNEYLAGTDPNVAQPPYAVTGLGAYRGNASVTLSWAPTHNAASYNIYWNTASGVSKTTGKLLGNVTRPYAHINLTNNTTYFYTVTAANAGGESPLSKEVSASPREPAWGTAIQLESNSDLSVDTHVAVDAIGNAIAIWKQDTGSGFDVFSSQFDVLNGRWNTTPVMIASFTSPSSNGMNGMNGMGNMGQNMLPNNTDQLSLAMNADGKAAAAWLQTEATGTALLVSRFDPKNAIWSAPERVGNVGASSFDPKITLSDSGDLMVAWKEQNKMPLTISLYSSSYLMNAGQWSAPASIAAGIIDPKVAVTANGKAIAIWTVIEPRTLKASLLTSRYDEMLAQWSVPAQLNVSAGGPLMPQVGLDAAGNGVAVWTFFDLKTFKFNLAATLLDASTGVWSTPVVIKAGSGVALLPQVAMGATRDAVVLWTQLDRNGTSLYASRYEPTTDTWSAPGAIESINGIAVSPQVAIDSKGVITAIWSQLETTTRKYSIYANRYDPAAAVWGAPGLLENDNVTNTDTPALGVSTVGNAVAVWTQGNGITNNVWANDYWIGDLNHLPVANAGPDQIVNGGATVTLNGSASTDPDGATDIAGYQWTEVSGVNVQINNATSVTTTFQVPNVISRTVLRFLLTVTDKAGATSSDLIDVVVLP